MPTLSTTDFITRYGAQAALADSVPEIMTLLQRAVNEGWTQDRFIAEFMNTAWYQTGGAAWRNANVAQQSDPGEYATSLSKVVDQIKRQSIQLGILMDDAEANSLAEGLLKEYWGQSIPTGVLDSRIMSVASMSKVFGGKTMSYSDSLKTFAASMGVKFDPGYFDSAAKSIAAGTSTVEQWNQAIKDAAKSRFPMFANQIDAGVTMDQIASPYKQAMSNILEVPYASIMLDDPTISKAFGSVNKDGQPAVIGLWDFEKSLRNDPRWVYTKNARSSIDAVAHKVLQDFGLVS